MTKKRGTWILVVLALSVGAFLGALRMVHGGTMSHAVLEKGVAAVEAAKGSAVVQKGVAAVEAAKGSGIHWKNLFIFLGIAIPAVAILTRVIAWLCGRKKSVLVRATQLMGDRRTAREVAAAQEIEARMEGIEWVEPKVGKPFASYEEYKAALTGDVDLEEFIARCRAGVPEDPKKKEKAEDTRKRLEELQKRIVNPITPPSSYFAQPQRPATVEQDRQCHGICHSCGGRGQWTNDGINMTGCGSCNGTGRCHRSAP